MKRMIREELIQKISELDVEELASAVAKAENSLQLPSEAPASKKMVVINTSGEQEMDDIPSGGIEIIDCNGKTTAEIVDLLIEKECVYVKNMNISGMPGYTCLCCIRHSSPALYLVLIRENGNKPNMNFIILSTGEYGTTKGQVNEDTIYISVPNTVSLDNAKTYTLKCISKSPQWVEDV